MIIPPWKNFGSGRKGNVRKRSRKRKAKPRPEYSLRIERLRGALKQHEFAAKLLVSPSRVSEWESGKRPPTAEGFYRLGSIAPATEDALWFWNQAGLDDEKLLAAARKLSRDRTKNSAPLVEKGDVVLVPCLRQTAVGRELENAGDPLPMPVRRFANPFSTFYLTIDRSFHTPNFRDGDTVFVDVSETDSRYLAPFLGEYVLAEFDPTPEDEMSPFRYGREGLYIARLRLDVYTLEPKPCFVWSANLDFGDEGALHHPNLASFRDEASAEELAQIPECDESAGVVDERMVEHTRLWSHAQSRSHQRALSTMQLRKGWRIIGRVVGWTAGNVK
jgi:transcriptional regulator with XRE-family HTH domain